MVISAYSLACAWKSRLRRAISLSSDTSRYSCGASELMSRSNLLVAVCSALLTLSVSADAWATWDGPIKSGSWRMDAPRGTVRWLVVHKVPSEGDPTFHVEVLQG